MFTIFSLRRTPQQEQTEIPRWKYSASLYRAKRHHMIFRDDDLGVERHIVTCVDAIFFLSGEKERYYIDGVDRSFHSEDEMLHELGQRKKAVEYNPAWEVAEA